MPDKNKRKKYSWKDNFVKEDNTPAEPQKRAGICSNCSKGAFTLEIGKNENKGFLLRVCKCCNEMINPETGQLIRRGESGFDSD